MKHADALLSSMDKSWKQFSTAWKKARAKGSDKAVHDLRVSARRLIASLELTRALFGETGIEDLRKRFKKVLKRMGPLRDVQVQLENLSQIHEIGPVKEFKRLLRRREREEIRLVRKDLKQRRRKRLHEEMTLVLSRFEAAGNTFDNVTVRQAIDRLLGLRHREFWRARSRFKPSNEETLHNMRIALKKLRYVVEAAQPVLGSWARQRARQMHDCQQLMGDTRDVQILKDQLEAWAARRGRKARRAIALELARLDRTRERLIGALPKASSNFQELAPPAKPRPRSKPAPAKEETRAVPLVEQTVLPVRVRTIH
jgi:CHAD domain-containing protein